MKNVSLRQIGLHLRIPCDRDAPVSGYQIDSRMVQEGELFFALPGKRWDGHRFLEEVKQRGGTGAVVLRSYTGPDFGLVLFRVEDVEASLQSLAQLLVSQTPKMQIVGITGSVGKTTAKEFAATLLQGKFRVGKSMASYNTQLTCPLSLLNRQGDEEVLVLEMGASAPGDLKKLVEIAAPDVAVITKVSLAHAAFFPGGIPEIAKAKAEIFSHAKTRLAIVDHGLSGLEVELPLQRLTFSMVDPSADFFLSSQGDRWALDAKGVRTYLFDLPFRATHILHNFLAAAVLAKQMGVSWDEIQKQVLNLQVPPMRFEIFEKDNVTWINDTYNASPASMQAALSSLPLPKEGGKRIAILGSMLELGSFSEEAHREVGYFAQKWVEHLLVLGEEAIPLYEAYQESQKPAEFFLETLAISQRLRELVRPGDVVLVKGSRGMQMEKVLCSFG